MDRNAISIVFFLFLIVADVSNASSFWKLRYLTDESPTKINTTAATPPSSPSPSPLTGSGANKTDLNPDTSSKLDPNLLNKTYSLTASPPPDDKKDPKSLNKTDSVTPPPDEKKDPKSPQKEIDGGNNSSSISNSKNDKTMENNEEKKKIVDSGNNPNSTETGKGVETKEDNKKKEKINGNESNSKPGIVETCDGIVNSCIDGKFLTACIKGFRSGSKELVVLVQNSGGKTLEVNVASPSRGPKGVKVPKHGTEWINVSLTVGKSSKLVLSAGNGDCELVVNPLVSEGNFLLNLPSYDKLVTPINGAYFLIVTVVIFGGSWACCMFRKRGRHDGIPYQELEMGLPESMEATEVETAEGWDQGWDDDWDEDKAVKSPAGCHVANISANGLTARSSNRDGWENDWDD